jgi:peptide methionine sulfoxide reductase MsrA
MISGLERKTGKKTFVSVEPFRSFFPAGEEYQDFYLKNPEALTSIQQEFSRLCRR